MLYQCWHWSHTSYLNCSQRETCITKRWVAACGCVYVCGYEGVSERERSVWDVGMFRDSVQQREPLSLLPRLSVCYVTASRPLFQSSSSFHAENQGHSSDGSDSFVRKTDKRHWTSDSFQGAWKKSKFTGEARFSAMKLKTLTCTENLQPAH